MIHPQIFQNCYKEVSEQGACPVFTSHFTKKPSHEPSVSVTCYGRMCHFQQGHPILSAVSPRCNNSSKDVLMLMMRLYNSVMEARGRNGWRRLVSAVMNLRVP